MPDATNRVLKEQCMVRRTETIDFGLAAGWAEDDGTTTTYQPFARGERRLETRPVPRQVQQRTAAPAGLYARRPSGVQPKVATPALDDFELIELDELDERARPFAPRRSAASASLWNTLGFAGLFASVLIGRVIVEAGQVRGGAKQDRAAEAAQPSAAASTGAAGVGPEAQRNAAAVSPERDGSPALAGDSAGGAATFGVQAGGKDLPSDEADAAKARGTRASARSAAVSDSPLPSTRTPAAAPSSSATEAQPTASDPSPRGRSHARRTESSQWRDGPTEPATRAQSTDWRDGPMEPATLSPARSQSTDWRDGPMEPATLSPTRSQSTDWRDGPMEPATSSVSSQPSAAPASLGQVAMGTLRINSRPWSQVFIDGRLIGNTPQMAVSLPAGRYSVRLSNPELGMSKTITVQVAAGELVTRVEALE